MADKKISQLSALTTQASADELVIVDSSASETKKITVNNLFQGIPVNVGIGTGTTSPGATLDVDGTLDIAPSSGDAQLKILNSANTGRSLIYFSDPDGTGGRILFNHATNAMSFETNGTSEAFQIDSNLNLLVGTTSQISSGRISVAGGASAVGITATTAATSGFAAASFQRTASNGQAVQFKRDTTEVGSISITTSATTYNTSSDERLKDNIVDAPSASDDIDAIQVRSFDWKADGAHQKYGMVAQELQGVAPEAVTGDADSDEMMGVDYSKLVPMLVKEIQLLRARVAQLEGEN